MVLDLGYQHCLEIHLQHPNYPNGGGGGSASADPGGGGGSICAAKGPFPEFPASTLSSFSNAVSDAGIFGGWWWWRSTRSR